MIAASPLIPAEADSAVAEQSSRLLAAHLHPQNQTQRLKIVEEDGTEQEVVIPAAAFHLLVDILSQMAQGNAVRLMPIHTELTSQEAADILNVSRPYFVKLLDSGEIPCRKVGRHRRVLYADLIAYKQKTDHQRMIALDKLAAQAQELNMGYE
jgi:excisionase family DNA binding protein